MIIENKADMYLYILIGILVVIFLVASIWIAYTLSAAYQQTLTLTLDFENTYRYVPRLNPTKKYKIDNLEVIISGKISNSTSTITLANKINNLIKETIIHPYRNCLIIQEANTFLIKEDDLKRCPINKDPTAENLSVLFFNKLSSLLHNTGSELISITIVSDGIKATNSRYKISNYTI